MSESARVAVIEQNRNQHNQSPSSTFASLQDAIERSRVVFQETSSQSHFEVLII